GGTRAEIAVDAARMNIVPKRVEPSRDGGDRQREAAEIPVQNQEPGSHDEQPQVAGALPERVDRADEAGQVDAGSIKWLPVIAGKERARKRSFRLGEEVQVVDVACQVEIRTTWIGCRQRNAELGDCGVNRRSLLRGAG